MSYLEDSFALWARSLNLPRHEREYRFAPPRRFRFDFAWPSLLFAVEIEGVTYEGGRHQTIKGFIADCEKYELAMMQGWTVYRIPGQWVATKTRHIWREQTGENLKRILCS